jgi:hypothetical protein
VGKYVDEMMPDDLFKEFNAFFKKKFPRVLLIATRAGSARSGHWRWTYFSISKDVNSSDVRKALVSIASQLKGVDE